MAHTGLVEIFNTKKVRTGYIENGVLVKTGLTRHEHMRHKKPRSWGTDMTHLQLLQELGGDTIQLKLTDESVFFISLEDALQYGFEDILRADYGSQWFVPVEYWQEMVKHELK